MKAEPQKEHQWLQRLIGEWTYEFEAAMAPNEPPVRQTGTDSVRSLGGVWVICDGQADMEGDDRMTTIMTLGYDPQKQRYLGTYIGSMMTYMWVYEGEVDSTGQVLTLNTEGPSFSAEGTMAKYKDVIEFKSDDQRLLTSFILGEDGTWTEFMKMTYQRRT